MKKGTGGRGGKEILKNSVQENRAQTIKFFYLQMYNELVNENIMDGLRGRGGGRKKKNGPELRNHPQRNRTKKKKMKTLWQAENNRVDWELVVNDE